MSRRSGKVWLCIRLHPELRWAHEHRQTTDCPPQGRGQRVSEVWRMTAVADGRGAGPQAVIKRIGPRTLLFDRSLVDDVFNEWFEPRYWRERHCVRGVAAGRGSAVFVESGDQLWVLRHYHRGGFMSRFVDDRYFWVGNEATRAFREWRLLSALHVAGLPVPQPIAARVWRHGLAYTADILTVCLEDTRSLDAMLHAGESLDALWPVVGKVLRQFHDCGVHHSDLNVRNILVNSSGRIFLVDFDKGSLREPGSWQKANLNRLQRSLRKTALETGVPYDPEVWRLIEAGYDGGA
jgi:3-deoxy-D-manno-octulosonic acid kinase